MRARDGIDKHTGKPTAIDEFFTDDEITERSRQPQGGDKKKESGGVERDRALPLVYTASSISVSHSPCVLV